MTKRIFRNFILIAFITLISCIVLFLGVLSAYFQSRIIDELEIQAIYIAQGIKNEGISYFDYLENTGNRITWIDSDGKIIYDSDYKAEDMENHADREEFIQAAKNGTGTVTRYSETMSQKTMYFIMALDDGTYIRVANDQYKVWILAIGIIQPIIIVIVIGFILSAVLASRISKRIVKPINEIDIENPSSNEVYEELHPLLKKINSLKRELSKRISSAEEKQKEFSLITENMQEGFIVIDSRTDILSYNTSALKFFNIKEDIKNKSVLTLNRSEKFRLAVYTALNGKNDNQIIELKDRYYQVISNPVYNKNEISGVVIVILDITEKQQRDIMRKEFTSNVSHELKTPLTGIYGTSEIIMNGTVKPEDIPHFAKNINNESGRLINLVNDIIKLSQLDEDSIPYKKEAVDLCELSKMVISNLQFEAKKKEIEFELVGEHVQVIGISTILEEMIYNICDNAIKYNKENGKVKINIVQDNESIKLSVSDTGIGISEAHRDRVFERFYRVDKSRSKEIGGTGLGLSIVKHAAAYHGAVVTLDSKENTGTVVTIYWEK